MENNDTYNFHTNISCYQQCLFGYIPVGRRWCYKCPNIIAQVFGYKENKFWISGILLVIFGIIGLLGNIFTIAVLCQPKMRKNVFYNLLLSLACFDTLFILSYGSYYAYISLPYHHHNINLMEGLTYHVREICLVGSIYMTVAISLERYLGICHPHLEFSRGALVYILPVLFINLAFNFPKFLEIKYSLESGTFEEQEFWETYQYEQGYRLWASVIFKTIIPLVSLLFLNGSIIATIKGTTHPQRTQARRDPTKILFCIVLVFLASHSVRVAHKFLVFLDKEHMGNWYIILPLTRLALTINSAVNFAIYSMVGRKFRMELLKLFKCKKAPTPNTSSKESGKLSSLEITSL